MNYDAITALPDKAFWDMIDQIEELSHLPLQPWEKLRVEMKFSTGETEVISGVRFSPAIKRLD